MGGSLSLPFGTLGFGGMPSLPGMQSSATSSLNSSGASWSASGAGDWSVNLGGSGTALQSASGGLNLKWLLIAAAAVGAAWYLRK